MNKTSGLLNLRNITDLGPKYCKCCLNGDLFILSSPKFDSTDFGGILWTTYSIAPLMKRIFRTLRT